MRRFLPSFTPGSLRRTARLTVTVAVALAAGGCMTGMPAPRGPVLSAGSGRKYLLREKYKEDDWLRYEAKMTYRAYGESSASEKVHSVVYRGAAGKPDGDLVNLYLRRRDITRRRVERTAKGNTIIENRPLDMQPVLSPVENRIVKKDGSAHFYRCDVRRRFAFTEERPFHQLNYVSIGFFFPILPKSPVGVGDTWSGGKLRVMIGFKYYFNNDFLLGSIHDLREMRNINGRTVAVIDFSYDGQFDSAEHPERFTDNWRNQGRVIHQVNGSGTVYFDVDEGRVIWKKDKAEVIVKREFYSTRTKKSPDRKTTTTDTEVVLTRTTVEMTQRLMAPGERLPGTGPTN